MPLFTSGGLRHGLGLVSCISSGLGLGLGLKNLVLFTSLAYWQYAQEVLILHNYRFCIIIDSELSEAIVKIQQ